MPDDIWCAACIVEHDDYMEFYSHGCWGTGDYDDWSEGDNRVDYYGSLP